MSDTNKHENTPQNGSSSLFLYTALIFVAAIIIIIFAYFTQTHVERVQPSAIPAAVAGADAPAEPGAEGEAGGPQGIAKTAAELSQDNLELLEENRALHNRVDELEARLETYEPFIEAYKALIAGDKDRIKLILEDIDYNTLPDEVRALYDFISSTIQ